MPHSTEWLNYMRVVQCCQIDSIGKWVINIGSFRSICQMVKLYKRFEKSSFPLECCISLGRLKKISPLQKVPINFCRFDRFGRFVKWRILIFDSTSPFFHWTVASHQRDFEKISLVLKGPITFRRIDRFVLFVKWRILIFDSKT